VSAGDVLHAVVMLGVVRHVPRALADAAVVRGPRLAVAERADELAEVDHVLGGLRQGDDLGLAR
jgi:hypothetical protein